MNALVVALLFASAAVCFGQQFDFGGGFDGAAPGAPAGGFDTSSFGGADGGAALGGDFGGGFAGDLDGGAGGFDTSSFGGGLEGFGGAAASSSRPQFSGYVQSQGAQPDGQ